MVMFASNLKFVQARCAWMFSVGKHRRRSLGDQWWWSSSTTAYSSTDCFAGQSRTEKESKTVDGTRKQSEGSERELQDSMKNIIERNDCLFYIKCFLLTEEFLRNSNLPVLCRFWINIWISLPLYERFDQFGAFFVFLTRFYESFS